VLDAWKKVENSVVSFAAVGLSLDGEAVGEAGAACEAAQALVASLFRPVLAALGAADEEVAGALLPFLGGYVSKIKHGAKRAGGALSQVPRRARQNRQPCLRCPHACRALENTQVPGCMCTACSSVWSAALPLRQQEAGGG
jgi:hypothetical protein